MLASTNGIGRKRIERFRLSGFKPETSGLHWLDWIDGWRHISRTPWRILRSPEIFCPVNQGRTERGWTRGSSKPAIYPTRKVSTEEGSHSEITEAVWLLNNCKNCEAVIPDGQSYCDELCRYGFVTRQYRKMFSIANGWPWRYRHCKYCYSRSGNNNRVDHIRPTSMVIVGHG